MKETDFTNYTEIEEKYARMLCISENVDPEKDCYGIGGNRIPKDFKCKAWKVRLPQIRVILAAVLEDNNG